MLLLLVVASINPIVFSKCLCHKAKERVATPNKVLDGITVGDEGLQESRSGDLDDDKARMNESYVVIG